MKLCIIFYNACDAVGVAVKILLGILPNGKHSYVMRLQRPLKAPHTKFTGYDCKKQEDPLTTPSSDLLHPQRQ